MFWTNVLIDVLLFFFVVVCVLMCLVVCMQRSKQEGLGAAFGGGITESVWGAQTSQVLVKATVWLAALFFILSISLARLYANRAAQMEKGSAVQQELLKSVVPATSSVAPASSGSAPAATPAPSTAPATPAAPAEPAKPAGK